MVGLSLGEVEVGLEEIGGLEEWRRGGVRRRVRGPRWAKCNTRCYVVSYVEG